MWRLLVPVSSAQVDPAEEQARQAHMEAVYGLAELLSEVCDAVDPQTYKSTAYAALAEMVDAAYDVLTKEESSTQELFYAYTYACRSKALTLVNSALP